MRTFLGIDIGGTSTRFLMMDASQKFYHFRKIPTASWAKTCKPLLLLAKIIKTHIEIHTQAENQIESQTDVNAKPIFEIMLGLPGILSYDRQQVLSLPFIQNINNQPVACLLSNILNCTVSMDKDVNHLLYWDLHQLPHLPRVAIGFYLGTGMGNSLWLDGRFYRGAHGAAGEIGHIPWAGNNTACVCGKSGCVESITSGNWLVHFTNSHFPDTLLADVFSQHGDHPQIKKFIRRLAYVIATEMNIFDPEVLILGGGVFSMRDFPMQALLSIIYKHLRTPEPAYSLKIIHSLTGDEAGCRGACLAALHHSQSKLKEF